MHLKCSSLLIRSTAEGIPALLPWTFRPRAVSVSERFSLLILSVSPHRLVPLGRRISSAKRKPLPHYAANFRHQEKMFGKFWPGFQELEWYSPLAAPLGSAGVILVLEQSSKKLFRTYTAELQKCLIRVSHRPWMIPYEIATLCLQ